MATDQSFYIRGTLKNAAGTARASTTVKAVRLQSPSVAASLLDSTQATAPEFTATTNASGVFTITCTHALAWTCPLTYKLMLPDGRYALIPVGVEDASRTFDVGTLLCEPAPAKVQDINITPLVQKNLREGTFGANRPVAAASTAIVDDKAIGDFHTTTITMNGVAVTVANTTGISFGGTKLIDFPAGRIQVMGAYQTGITFGLTNAGNVTPIDGTMGGDVSFGTTAPTDGTLTAADVDIVPSASIDPISGGCAISRLAASATFDGTSTPIDVFVNVLIDDADVADAASDVLEVSGTLVINWIFAGDV
jgi:hypothetical protein